MHTHEGTKQGHKKWKMSARAYFRKPDTMVIPHILQGHIQIERIIKNRPKHVSSLEKRAKQKDQVSKDEIKNLKKDAKADRLRSNTILKGILTAMNAIQQQLTNQQNTAADNKKQMALKARISTQRKWSRDTN